MKEKIVLDPAVLMAAAYNRSGSSARIIQAIEDGHLDMVWNDALRGEVEKLLEGMPHALGRISGLFSRKAHFKGETPGAFSLIKEEDQRKVLALASTADAVLISSDESLLRIRPALDVTVMTPKEFLDHWQAINGL